jgi:plastocyanin domain-containing protein
MRIGERSRAWGLKLVLGVGLLLVGTGCGPSSTAEEATLSPDGAYQEISVTVSHGYHPDQILAKAGVPLRLHFYRDEQGGSCGEALAIPSYDIETALPNRETVTVNLPGMDSGVVDFQCGMNMWRGKIIVQP